MQKKLYNLLKRKNGIVHLKVFQRSRIMNFEILLPGCILKQQETVRHLMNIKILLSKTVTTHELIELDFLQKKRYI